ncbi:MAG: helix-turn-helix domain-containing protein, partial [Bryobacteraceae bacterium]
CQPQFNHIALLRYCEAFIYAHPLTAMSPLQYQKQIRLQEARARMSIHGLDAGSAALEVGYESARQFMREYKRLFGPNADPGYSHSPCD